MYPRLRIHGYIALEDDIDKLNPSQFLHTFYICIDLSFDVKKVVGCPSGTTSFSMVTIWYSTPGVPYTLF